VLRLFFVLLLLTIAVREAVEAARVQAPAPAGARSTVVVSDMHMGPGRAPSGAWYPTEDFRWPSEFAAFLKAIDQEGRGASDLVLNGDTFELLQSNIPGCEPIAADAGCREADALARLDRVLSAHQAEIDALAQFARSGSNRVVLVAGDHDAALMFPAVGRRAIDALGAPAGRVEVAASGYWLSADGKIYAEHGHQISFNAHRFEAWPSPFVTRAGVAHVARPWGEQTVQPFYDTFEERYPIVDNFGLAGAGLKYAFAADGAAEAGDAAPRLLRYLVMLMSWQQFRMELDGGETEAPTWDLAQARAQGGALLVSSLPDDDRFKPLAAKALADGRLTQSAGELTDEELVALCDYRAASRRARRRGEPFLVQFTPRGPIVTECPRTPDSRGSLFDYFWRSRDQLFLRHLEGVARRMPGGEAPTVLVHGHTHVADRGQEGAITLAAGHLTIPRQGFSPVRGAVAPVAINGGAWQRTITPVQFEQIEMARGLPRADLLRALQPEDLPACYSFVHIAPYTDAPAPNVRYWRQSAAGEWGLAAGCGR
jgi:UDP-2,3-diacylglucosamine pyrophosphatase LpxH